MPEADKRSLLQALQQFHNYYLEKKYNNYWQVPQPHLKYR